MAQINLNKRPSPKYLAKRTISFAAVGEIEHVRADDNVNITIATKSGNVVVSVKGKDFLKNLEPRTAKNGTAVLVFEF